MSSIPERVDLLPRYQETTHSIPAMPHYLVEFLRAVRREAYDQRRIDVVDHVQALVDRVTPSTLPGELPEIVAGAHVALKMLADWRPRPSVWPVAEPSEVRA